jgi:hypothetical protein
MKTLLQREQLNLMILAATVLLTSVALTLLAPL